MVPVIVNLQAKLGHNLQLASPVVQGEFPIVQDYGQTRKQLVDSDKAIFVFDHGDGGVVDHDGDLADRRE